MRKKKGTGASKWVDPDDAPELTKEWFETADLYHGDKLIRRGRPKLERVKEVINIRLAPDVVDHFRAGGKGWQTRMGEVLERHVARTKKKTGA